MRVRVLAWVLVLVVCLLGLIKESCSSRHVVRREERESFLETEDGAISGLKISAGNRGPYHLQFITLEPNSVFLPVLLHADMVFYVQSGSGKLSTENDDKEMRNVNLKKGDVYRLKAGSVFFVQSDLDAERHKLRICAIFSNTEDGTFESAIGAYSSIRDLLLGFDRKVLQSAFMVDEEVIEEIKAAARPPSIIHALPGPKKSVLQQLEEGFIEVIRSDDDEFTGSNKKKSKTFNMLEARPDFHNCNGWSVTVDKRDCKSLKGSHVGVFMVNLTRGSMMGPHWNPMATEIALVLHGSGMIRVVCPRAANVSECKNVTFRVDEGDLFAVPRFHAMAQMAFNNDSLVFMGFTTTTKKNHPQFLAGKRSVLKTLDRDVLAASFNVSNTTIDQLLNARNEEIILECISCAEEEERKMEEEIERKKQEQEEARKREEEEEKARREEEEAREREEARKREEEEKARREEEEAKRQEEERQRRREEEEERQREEEAKKREEEEEEARKKEEEEARERKEEEEARKEEEAKREEEERQRRREEEEARKRKEEEAKREEDEAKREEEERQRRREEEEEERRQEEEEKRREEEKARREEEERREEEWRKEDDRRKREEDRRRRAERAQREQERAREQQEERERRWRREEERHGQEAEERPEKETEQGSEYEKSKEKKEKREGGGGSDWEPRKVLRYQGIRYKQQKSLLPQLMELESRNIPSSKLRNSLKIGFNHGILSALHNLFDQLYGDPPTI